MITSTDDHCYWCSLLLIISAFDDHYYWWSLLLMINIIDDHYNWWSLLLMLTVFDNLCFWWSLLLMITTINDHYYCWSLLLLITTIGDHYRGSDLPPCLHADAFHSPVSKPLHQRTQIKMLLHQRSPQSKTEKLFSFQCGLKETLKKTLITIHRPPL